MNTNSSDELTALCESVRKLSEEGNFEECCKLICDAMAENPDAPEPHNLLGIILEKTHNHIDAMKHFRVACDLEPTYQPARHNLNICGTSTPNVKCAFDISDCPKEKKSFFDKEIKIK